MPLLSTTIPQGASEALSGFLRWWLQELRAMVPAALAARRDRRPTAMVMLEPGRVVVERVKAGIGDRLIEERPLDAFDDDAWAELASLLGDSRTSLAWARPDIFYTRVTLPAAARNRLGQAIRLQLPSIAPVDPSQLVWSYEVVRADKAQIEVVVVMAKSQTIHDARQMFVERDLPLPEARASAEGRLLKLSDGHAPMPAPLGISLKAWGIAALIIASIPVSTILGAKFAATLAEGRIEVLQQELEPRLQSQKRTEREEQMRAALRPIFQHPSATDTLQALALGTPEDSFVMLAERNAHGALLFTTQTPNREALEKSMREIEPLKRAAPLDMAANEAGQLQVTYRVTR